MRVAQYCQTFSLLSETAIYTWVTELERQGVDCHVVTHRRVNEERRPFEAVHLVSQPRDTDPDRLWWRAMEALGRTTAPTSWYTTVRRRLARTVRQVRPDVLHAHFGNDAWVAAPVARAEGVPLVVTFHGYDISELVKDEEWRRRYREELWPAVSFATVLSEEMREAAERLGCPPEKVRVVHVGRRVDEVPVREAEPGGPFTVVSVGRLTAKKGHADAIAAVGRLASEGRPVRLRIFGDGELRGELERQAEAAGLGGVVRLEGARPNGDVLRALQEAHAFVLCSKTAPNGDREGTPNVLVEAQAAGLPCVSTRHAGIPEMVPDEAQWLLAEEGDAVGIAERLGTLMDLAPEERAALGARGRAKMMRDYDLETECRKFRALYDAAVRPAAAPLVD
jgi:glycosyltransferase involved in cell wall biosynthesis